MRLFAIRIQIDGFEGDIFTEIEALTRDKAESIVTDMLDNNSIEIFVADRGVIDGI